MFTTSVAPFLQWIPNVPGSLLVSFLRHLAHCQQFIVPYHPNEAEDSHVEDHLHLLHSILFLLVHEDTFVREAAALALVCFVEPDMQLLDFFASHSKYGLPTQGGESDTGHPSGVDHNHSRFSKMLCDLYFRTSEEVCTPYPCLSIPWTVDAFSCCGVHVSAASRTGSNLCPQCHWEPVVSD